MGWMHVLVLVVGLAGCGYDQGTVDAGAGSGSNRLDARPGPFVDAPTGAACSNGIDDDCDGTIDLADPGCTNALDGDERGVGSVCDDGLDNDNDGTSDFVMSGCGTTPGDPGCSSPDDPTEL